MLIKSLRHMTVKRAVTIFITKHRDACVRMFEVNTGNFMVNDKDDCIFI